MEKAFQGQNWDQLLELLRRPPHFVSPDQVAYLRGRAWQELGHPEVALRFFDNASRLRPGHSPYLILSLECLKETGNWEDAIKRATQFRLDSTSSPSLLFRAGDVFHAYALSHKEQIALFEDAVETIDRGFSKLQLPDAVPPLDSVVVAAFATKAFSLEHLGRVDEAFRTYDQALERFPTNPQLLTARGLLRQAHRMETAINDFETAVANSARVIWPYLQLARHWYGQNSFDKVIDYCRMGIEMTDRDSIAALIFELLAIALFKKHGSNQTVERAFLTAISLDPFNLTIQQNYELFKKTVRHPQQAEANGWVIGVVSLDQARSDLYKAVQPSLAVAA